MYLSRLCATDCTTSSSKMRRSNDMTIYKDLRKDRSSHACWRAYQPENATSTMTKAVHSRGCGEPPIGKCCQVRRNPSPGFEGIIKSDREPLLLCPIRLNCMVIFVSVLMQVSSWCPMIERWRHGLSLIVVRAYFFHHQKCSSSSTEC